MERLAMLMKHKDIMLSVAIAMMIALLLLPIPPMLLDVLLTINLALSITMLLVTIYTNEPLEYSSFPTILLVATLFRLGMNVSTTRLILTTGQGGQVIEAFGNFVVGGNYLVGVLIFIILVVINFIVITNGAGRVAEVAARFTLDAMPGKQLSIDADLNAGLINEAEAKTRRRKIQTEADFYGTMDGASKFVKGDAIAGIIIVIINLIGGLVVGVFQLGMPIEQAVQTFTVLSIGDGLVSQMPALVISTATGILITRVSEDTTRHLGDDIQSQMFTNPKILGTVAVMLGALALTPGLPTLPFLSIAAVAGAGAYFLVKAKRDKQILAEAQPLVDSEEEAARKKPGSREAVMELLQVEAMELEIGYRLVPLLEGDSGGDLLDRIAQIRRQVATELGIVLPSIRVRDNLQLKPNGYQIKLRGVVIDTGEVRPDMVMAMNTDGSPDTMEGIETKEPAFGLPALWIYKDQQEMAEVNGYTVVTASAVVATHLSETVKRYACDIITRVDVQQLLENLKETAESLVDDVVPDLISLPELHAILQNLLRERVCVRDLSAILDAIGYHARVSKELDYLTEHARLALSRSICKQYEDPLTGELPVITLLPSVEDDIASGLTEDKQVLSLSPAFTQGLLTGINQQVEQVLVQEGIQPVLLCNAMIRLPMRRLIERMLPQIAVLSYNEIGPSVKVRSYGSVEVTPEPMMM